MRKYVNIPSQKKRQFNSFAIFSLFSMLNEERKIETLRKGKNAA